MVEVGWRHTKDMTMQRPSFSDFFMSSFHIISHG
jgi:hypothetical protein